MTFKNWGDNPFIVAFGMLASLATIVGALYAFNKYSSEESYKQPSVSPSPTFPITSSKSFGVHVIDDDNKQPLNHVKVTVLSSSAPDFDETDNSGYTYFPVPPNNSIVKLSLTKKGYQEQTFNVDVTTYVNRPKEFSLKKKY
jgi:hypothetical protein